MMFSFFFKRNFFLTVNCCQEYSGVVGNFLWNMPLALIFTTPHPTPVWRNNKGKRKFGEHNQKQGWESG